MDKKTRDHDAMMQGLNWWGIPTLFRCPYNSDSEGCNIALVGVPTVQETEPQNVINIWPPGL